MFLLSINVSNHKINQHYDIVMFGNLHSIECVKQYECIHGHTVVTKMITKVSFILWQSDG